MGCGASSNAHDVSEPQPLPARGKRFAGWENEAGWGEMGSVADPQTPEMDALWKVVPAALSNLQLKAFQRVLLLNASDLHGGLKGFMKVCRKGAGTVHNTRLAMAADLPSKSNNKDISPLLKRFVYAMSGCEGRSREMPFRSYLVCLKIMHKFKATQTDKLKFWFNVMKCSDNSLDGDAMADRIEVSADYDMVCSFIADAVLSDVNAAHAKSRSRVMSSVKTTISTAGFQGEDIITFAHFCRICSNISPSYASTLSTIYDRLRSAFLPMRVGKVSSLGSLKIKAYFYERAQQMVDLERELGNASIADSSGWKHSFTGDNKRPNVSAVPSFVDSDEDESMLSVVDSSILSRASSSSKISSKHSKNQPPSLSNARRSSRAPFSSISSSSANTLASGADSAGDASIISNISKGVRIDDSALDISVSSQASFASSNISAASSSSSKAQLKSALREARAGRHAPVRPAAEDVLQEVDEEDEEGGGEDWGPISQADGKGGFLLQAFKSSLEYLENVKNEEAARAAALKKERDERIRGVIERESTSKAAPVGIYVSGGHQREGERASRPKRAPGALRRARIAGGGSDEDGAVWGGRPREMRMLSSSREFHGFESPKVGEGEGGAAAGGGVGAGWGGRRISGTPFGIRPLDEASSPAKSLARSSIGTPYSSEKATFGASGAGHSFFGGGPARGLAVDDLMATPSRGERERRDYDDSVSAMAKLTFGSFDQSCANEARGEPGEVAGFDSRAASDKPWLAAALTRQSMVGAF